MNWHICKGKRLETLLGFLLLISLSPAYAQEAATCTGCSVRGFFHQTWSETSQFGHGLKAARMVKKLVPVTALSNNSLLSARR